MTKFIVDLDLDGYEDTNEHDVACQEFIHDQLNFAGSGVTVTRFQELKLDAGSFGRVCLACGHTKESLEDVWGKDGR